MLSTRTNITQDKILLRYEESGDKLNLLLFFYQCSLNNFTKLKEIFWQNEHKFKASWLLKYIPKTVTPTAKSIFLTVPYWKAHKVRTFSDKNRDEETNSKALFHWNASKFDIAQRKKSARLPLLFLTVQYISSA